MMARRGRATRVALGLWLLVLLADAAARGTIALVTACAVGLTALLGVLAAHAVAAHLRGRPQPVPVRTAAARPRTGRLPVAHGVRPRLH